MDFILGKAIFNQSGTEILRQLLIECPEIVDYGVYVYNNILFYLINLLMNLFNIIVDCKYLLI